MECSGLVTDHSPKSPAENIEWLTIPETSSQICPIFTYILGKYHDIMLHPCKMLLFLYPHTHLWNCSTPFPVQPGWLSSLSSHWGTVSGRAAERANLDTGGSTTDALGHAHTLNLLSTGKQISTKLTNTVYQRSEWKTITFCRLAPPKVSLLSLNMKTEVFNFLLRWAKKV